MKKGLLIILAVLLAVTLIGCGSKKAEETRDAPQRQFAAFGTGGVTGVYYPAVGAISRIVNKKYDEYNLKVTVESTGGSVFNVNAIMAGDLEFGMVQSDRQAQAWEGTAEWDGNAQKDLRAVFSLHPETVTLLAAVDAGINTLEDLRGKIVNIGNPGSGARINSIDALETVGINWETDIQAEGLKASEAPKMLQDGRIDAYFYTVGHPSGSFKEATAGKRKVKFIPIENVDELLAKYSYYAKSCIPAVYYPNAANTTDTNTYGVKATFCTSANVSDDIVYAITKEVFENLEDFKALHPAFATLTAKSMLEGLTAPIHDGAMRYFKEAGLK